MFVVLDFFLLVQDPSIIIIYILVDSFVFPLFLLLSTLHFIAEIPVLNSLISIHPSLNLFSVSHLDPYLLFIFFPFSLPLSLSLL
jgi:hypothetical protein